MVFLWYGVVVALWVATVYWIYFRDGAEELTRFPAIVRVREPWVIKAYIGLCLAGGVGGLMMMIFGNLGAP